MPGDPKQKLIAPNLFRIASEFRALQPNIIISVTPGPFGLLGYYYAKRAGIPFLFAFHTDFEGLTRMYWRRFFRMTAGAYLRTVNTLLSSHSETVLVLNEKLIPQVQALGVKRTAVMGTPLPMQILEKPVEPLPAKLSRICFAGRLAEEKNVDLIIETASNFSSIEFIIAGDGPLKEKLERSALGHSNIRFTGWLSRDRLIRLIDSCSLLLLPSKLETFGSIALEAMARGRLVLVSQDAGIYHWQELRQGLYSFKTGSGLSQAIQHIMDESREKHLHKSATARALAEELNERTLNEWLHVLASYSQASTAKAVI